jgi:hypothetical protein
VAGLEGELIAEAGSIDLSGVAAGGYVMVQL